MKNSSPHDAKYWIENLRLEPHPEGGYFRQTYKSELRVEARVDADSHPVAKSATRVGELLEFCGVRAASTAIYFLLEGKEFSAFHRLRSDEVWHFYAGSSLKVHVLDSAGEYSSTLLGSDFERGEGFQAVVKAGCWFGSEVEDQRSWALVGCTVAPGFEFEDFELARREELAKSYPRHRELIERLTRQ